MSLHSLSIINYKSKTNSLNFNLQPENLKSKLNKQRKTSSNSIINKTNVSNTSINLLKQGKFPNIQINLNKKYNITYMYNHHKQPYENMKDKHDHESNFHHSKFNGKTFVSYAGSNVFKSSSNRRIRFNSKDYTNTSLSVMEKEFLKENTEKYKKTTSNQLEKHKERGVSETDKLYKKIFDRPILFKDNMDNEFKLTCKEYDMLYDNNLLKNSEQDENKILVTNRKVWLIKGAIDHLYPKVMTLRTELIRNGFYKSCSFSKSRKIS